MHSSLKEDNKKTKTLLFLAQKLISGPKTYKWVQKLLSCLFFKMYDMML